MDCTNQCWPPLYCPESSCGCSSGPTLISFAYGTQSDAFGRLRVSQPYTLFDSHQRFSLDDNFISNTAAGGTITFLSTQSSANLTVTNTVGSYAARETKYIFTYQPGKSLLSIMTFVMAPISSSNLVQRVGYFGAENGYYVELSDQLYIVERSNVTGIVTNTAVAQSSWNTRKLQGVGGDFNLDMTKSQIFWIDMEWLGCGTVRAGFILNGQYIVAHIFHHANINSTVYISTATLPIRYEIQTLTSDAPAHSNLTQICSTVISEGGYDQPYRLFSNITQFSSVMTAGVWYPIVSLRLAPGRLDSVVIIKQIDIIMSSTDILHWALWSNVTTSDLTGENFTAHGYSQNVQVDRSATAINTASCVQIVAGLVSGTNQSAAPLAFDLAKFYSQLGRDSFARESRIFTLAFYSIAGVGGGGASAQVLLSWNELI